MKGTPYRLLRLFGCVVLLLTLACVFGPRPRSEPFMRTTPPDSSLVIGYLEPRSIPGGLDFVDLLLLDPGVPEPVMQMGVHQGYFHGAWLLPGPYVLKEFGRLGRSSMTVERQQSPFQVDIGAREIRFLGAWRFVRARRRQFELEPLSSPGERQALETLLPLAAGTVWEERMRERLAGLP